MELMKEDIYISLATGRLHSAATEIAKELSLNGYIISLDGALIKRYKDDKTIFESFLKNRHVEKAISISNDLLINIVLCHAKSIYYTDYNSVIPSLLSKYGALYKQIKSYEDYLSGTLEIVCASDMKASIKSMHEAFTFPTTVGCSTSFFKSHSYENIFYLEIRKAGCNKGKGLKTD